jgi:hypothetical protein
MFESKIIKLKQAWGCPASGPTCGQLNTLIWPANIFKANKTLKMLLLKKLAVKSPFSPKKSN